MENILFSQEGLILSALRSNLAIALFLLPRAQRKDALLFYTFCHTVDNIADDPLLSRDEKEKQLAGVRLQLAGVRLQILTKEKLFKNKINLDFVKICSLTPFFEMVARRNINREQLCEIIRGVEMDLSIHRYETFENLRPYLWRVASVVGLVSVELFGAKGKTVNEYAEQLGVALQLTNILRDVAEDAAMGRIYLPLEDLDRFQVNEEELLKALPSPQAIHLFHYEAERALSYFAKAETAWKKLTPHEHRLLRPARLMEAIYRELLQLMQRDCYDLFYQRYKVGMLKKIMLAAHVMVSHCWGQHCWGQATNLDKRKTF